MKRERILLWSIAVLILSCQQPDMKFKITEITTLENIPGASGIGINEQHIMIIGDNSPYLYLLNHAAQPSDLIKIFATEKFEDGVIIKSLKPDFEAMELIRGDIYEEVLIFGSGSRSPQRDIFVHVTLAPQPHVRTYDLVTFYNQLRNMDIMSGHELNIEAVTYYDHKLLLFNRGKNLVFSFDYEAFLGFVKGESPYQPPKVTEFDLPEIKGLVSGFSGATIIPETSTILFTTSVEDTPNAYDDGEVLGSFIGMVDLSGPDLPIRYFLIEDDILPYPVKIESVAILNAWSHNELTLLMVTDSDGDESLLIKGLLTW